MHHSLVHSMLPAAKAYTLLIRMGWLILTRYFAPFIDHCCKPGGCDIAFFKLCNHHPWLPSTEPTTAVHKAQSSTFDVQQSISTRVSSRTHSDRLMGIRLLEFNSFVGIWSLPVRQRQGSRRREHRDVAGPSRMAHDLTCGVGPSGKPQEGN